MDKNYLRPLKKQIIKSIIDILILQTLKDCDLCGNEIINQIHSKFEIRNLNLTYAILNNLIKKGLITYKNVPNRKKFYSLTEKGDLTRKEMIEQYFNLHTKIIK